MELVSTRREFVLGAAALLAAGCTNAQGAAGTVADIEAELGGRVGFGALDSGSGRSIRHRADERFAMCSTFKAPLAAAVMARIEAGEIGAEDVLTFDPETLLPTSAIAGARPDGRIRVIEACEAVVSYSDNTAANLLLERIGGPAAMTEYFRSLGDGVSRLDRYEMGLNANIEDDPRDTTTPDAMLGNLQALLLGDALGAPARDLLTAWMVNEQNGRRRIRAGLPPGWRVANKPGTSVNGATNDIAVAWPQQDISGGAPIVFAAYVDAPGAAPAAREAAIARLARLAAQEFGAA